MQASRRARDHERLYQTRRGHAPQISISDDSHHVTEAIGGMYGDEDEYTQTSPRAERPLSFVPAPLGDTIHPRNALHGSSSPVRPSALRTPSYERGGSILGGITEGSPTSYHNAPVSPGTRAGSLDRQGSIGNGSGHSSPTALSRSPSETAQQPFPMTDLDSSAAVAQELSNLQAIRRMSMDVHRAADPDLPSFTSGWQVPAVAPSHDTDEEDPSSLFWVPASVHPELAPKAFETFIQDRVKTIKRSSLSSEPSSLSLAPSSVDGGGSLRRKKSMLSRQVNDSHGYQDGAERLERKRMSRGDEPGTVSLQELEDFAQDPSSLVRRLSIDNSRSSLEAAPDQAEGGILPMIPPKPPGQSLKRSTRTTYRRGSQRKTDRLGSRRGLKGAADDDLDDPPLPHLPETADVPQLPALSDFGSLDTGLQRVQSEPATKPRTVENFSRPGRKGQTPPLAGAEFDFTEPGKDGRITSQPEDRHKGSDLEQGMYPPRGSSSAKQGSASQMQVPTIVETPPLHDHEKPYSPSNVRPDRTTSIEQSPSQPPSQALPSRPGQQRPTLSRPASLQHARSQHKQHQHLPQGRQTFDGMVANPQAFPEQNVRTDNLSIVPTYPEDKKTTEKDKKNKDKKDDGPKKTSWSLFSGRDDKDKEEKGKKNKVSKQKPGTEKSHDETRLDLLQTSIDGTKGRESLVLDRNSIQIEQPTPKSRKSTDSRKEKDTGLFSSLFSSKKREKDGSGRKYTGSLRGLSPEPPQRRLQPDIDYNWSRFSILEERAIYRMAHIKLANPRRELYSQVLLSNFMYSYLAKVQMMHPQAQIAQQPGQKGRGTSQQTQKQGQGLGQQHQDQRGSIKDQGQQQQPQQHQPEEYQQYQRYQEQQARHDGSGNGNASNVYNQKAQGQAQSQQQSQQLQHGNTDLRGYQHQQQQHHQHQQRQLQQQKSGYGQQQHYGHANGNSHHDGNGFAAQNDGQQQWEQERGGNKGGGPVQYSERGSSKTGGMW